MSEKQQEKQLRIVRPRVDVFENESQVTIVADMPGVAPENAGIDVDNRILTISGRKSAAESKNGHSLLWAEFEPVQYQREFQISDQMDVDKAKAVTRHGVLTITIPKHESAKARKIQITAG